MSEGEDMTLRQQAEKQLGDQELEVEALSPDEVRAVVHDLRVHQVELEIQNEELRNVQAMLEASRDSYARLFDEAPVGYLEVDREGRIMRCNSTFAEMIGRTRSDLLRRFFDTLVVEPDRAVFLARFSALAHKSVSKSLTMRLVCAEGRQMVARVQLKSGWRGPSPAGTDEAAPRVLMTIADVSREAEARAELIHAKRRLELRSEVQACFLSRDEDELFAEVLELVKEEAQSPLGYFGYIDERGDLVCPSMTREVYAACQLPGKKISFPRSCWGGLWGRSLLEQRTLVSNESLEPPEKHLPLRCAVAVPLLHGGELIGQIVVANRDGGYTRELVALVEEMAAVVTPILFEYRRASAVEAQLRQAQKMESVGRLAGGVAHDFNNLLTGVIGYIELASQELHIGHPAKDVLREARACSERAAELVQGLLAFSRKQNIRRERFDLGAAVAKMGDMLRRVVSEELDLQVELPEQPCWVVMDRNQLEQMLTNLVVNAADAVSGEGRIRITVGEAEPEEAERRGLVHSGAGFWRLSVADTGCGIPREIRDSIFEPFFTTKEKGIGTGLGLAMVQGAVVQNGGAIWVDSKSGRGAVFHILLPRVEAEPRGEVIACHSDELTQGQGAILVVEDDAGLRKLCCKVLERAGYRVHSAEDGTAALELMKRLEQPLDMLVSDVVMPRLGGVELARRAEASCPGVKVILMSGYSDEVSGAGGMPDNVVDFLRKPFRPQHLVDLVSRILATGDE